LYCTTAEITNITATIELTVRRARDEPESAIAAPVYRTRATAPA
jgi:hypothetical protein